MIQVDIKPALLELFKDEEIKQQIIKIVESRFNRENNKITDDKYNDLLLKVDKLEREKKDIEQELDKKEMQLKNAQDKLDDLENKLQPVGGMLDLWDRIQNIPERHRKYFNELSGGENMIAYFSIGRDMAKMKQLQNYIQDIAVEDAEEDTTYNTLNDLLCFCVDVCNYSKSHSERLNKIHIDSEDFDINTCVKTSSSRNTGYISSIMIQGFCNQEGKTIFSNVVRMS